jgi:hypothetical protein
MRPSLSTRKPKTQTKTKTQEQHALNDNVEDVKHNDKWSSPSHASTIQLMDANVVSPVSRYNDLKAKSLVLPPLIKVSLPPTNLLVI